MNNQITVGISLFAMPDSHIWSNGIHQNVAFFINCLKKVPGVGRIVLLNSGLADELPDSLEFDSYALPLVKPQAVTHDVDLVIEMGGKLPQEWIRRVKARGVITFERRRINYNDARDTVYGLARSLRVTPKGRAHLAALVLERDEFEDGE